MFCLFWELQAEIYYAIMKQQFENPEMDVIELDVRDIIATSGDGEGEGEDFTS